MAKTKDQAGRNGSRTLQEQHFSVLEKIRVNAQALGSTNLPSDKDENLEGYLKSSRGAYDNMLAHELRKIPANADFLADIESKTSEEKGGVLREKLAEAKHKLRTETLLHSEMDADDGSHINTFFIWVGIIIIACCEAFLSYKSVGSLLDVGSNIVMMIILIGFAALYICIPKALQWFFEEYAESKPYKILLYLIPILILGAGYYTLGYLRSHFIAMQTTMDVNADPNTPPSFIASPLVFCAINMLFLLASYFLNSKLPSDTQTKNRKGLEKHEKLVSKLEREVEQLEQQLMDMPDREKNSQIRASNSNVVRKELYTQVNSLFHEAAGVFIETNLKFRADGKRVRAFDVPVEDLRDNYSNQ
jgi:hypothetical protein